MTTGVFEQQTTTPVDAALTRLRASLDQLIAAVEDGGLDHLDDAQLVRFLQAFEVERNRMALVDHRALRDAEQRNLAERLGQSRLSTVLTSALRISAGEATRRVRAAAAVGGRVSMLGERLSPRRPVLALVQRFGKVSPEQVSIIERGLDRVDGRGFDPADLTLAEVMLTGHALTFGPKDLKQLVDYTVDRIDPDGTLPKDELNADRRHFHLRPAADGTYRGEFLLTGAVGAKLAAVLGPLARARADLDAQPDGHPLGMTDLRTYGQRMHDAVEEVCDRLLRTGTLPDSGGTPATVIITINLDDILSRAGYGVTSDGTLIPTARVLELADQADLVWTFINRHGNVLDQGRTRRIATPAQTYALIARDAGCSFPGCTHPAEWCERHHVIDWASGGLTNLNNLTLVCRYHHHNFAKHGWTCRINDDGIPEWTPPRWVDPAQKPFGQPPHPSPAGVAATHPQLTPWGHNNLEAVGACEPDPRAYRHTRSGPARASGYQAQPRTRPSTGSGRVAGVECLPIVQRLHHPDGPIEKRCARPHHRAMTPMSRRVRHTGTMRDVVILGSTGSIGTQALEVIADRADEFRVVGLAAGGGQVQLLARQALDVKPQVVAVSKATVVQDLQLAFYAEASRRGWSSGEMTLPRILAGPDAAAQLAAYPCDVVLNGITGSTGLAATMATLKAGTTLALANKESLVVGGRLVTQAAAPGQIVAVDSEHSALAQCLRGGKSDEVDRLILTASGGPFRGRTREQMADVTPEQAMAHPTWAMGRVITTNSATLVNKGLELLEAYLLYGVPLDRIDVVVHPQSIVHSMVQFVDGSTLAQCSPPDMKLPIALGLSWPDRLPGAARSCDWTQAATWTFEPLDNEAFPAVELARESGRLGGTAPAVYNAANEVCVDAFHDGQLGFTRILDVVAAVLAEHVRPNTGPSTVDDVGSVLVTDPDLSLEVVLAADRWARHRAQQLVETEKTH